MRIELPRPIGSHALALTLTLAASLVTGPARADEASDLAKKLSNPIASLISVPFQFNWDDGLGSFDTDSNKLLFQPVIPVSLNKDWNVIIRTIVPLVDVESPVPGGSDFSGMGDIVQSYFFSPKALTSSGWTWGAGPAFSLPTASEDALGSGKWSAGPTFVALKQEKGWTWGVLANHLWSVAGDDDRAETSTTFVQPFLSRTTPTHTTLGLNTESVYDWESEQWTVPINASISQLIRVGKRPVSLSFGVRVYAERPPGGPDWGLRFGVTLLFPK